jgi:hypothetical protein
MAKKLHGKQIKDSTILQAHLSLTTPIENNNAATKLYVDNSITGTTSLSTALSTEISIRGSQDTSLSTTLSTEVSVRGSTDTALSTDLSTELSVRGSQVTSLSTIISSETSSRISADSSLETAISSSSGSAYLSGLTDVSVSNLNNNDILIYSGSSWINTPNLWAVDENSAVTLVNTNYNLVLANIQIEQDGGVRKLSDMTVTSASTSGTENSYSLEIDDSSILRIYSESNGSGGLTSTGAVLDGDYFYFGNPTTDGSWRWFVNNDGDLEFQKRVSGSWVYKNKMT